MTLYTVEKLSPGRWQIMRFDHGRTVGTKLGILPSKRDAVQSARLLAGWRGRVVVH